MVIDRNKYMDAKEARQLRTVTEARAIVDLRAGRVLGVHAWMLVDLALSTGLRVSEIAALRIRDVDLKRGCLSVIRLKRKKKVKETLALGKDIAQHLKEYIAWTGLKKGDVTLPGVLRENGYKTIHVGKGHFGPYKHDGENPANLGFDVNIGGGHWGHPPKG